MDNNNIKYLKDIMGLSLKEIAYMMCATERTVKNKMYNNNLLTDRDKMIIRLIRENHALKKRNHDN